ncbi:PREDICTED: serine protease 44 [Elephantulus edwardii]|uniref:serine protease 44 n=1 Tax=Elephantulus edwardii TaxID=28737 RepID=UPI0003F0B9E7|nr:PREDICTED: serine protease 44 [Elephantulus edwardii]
MAAPGGPLGGAGPLALLLVLLLLGPGLGEEVQRGWTAPSSLHLPPTSGPQGPGPSPLSLPSGGAMTPFWVSGPRRTAREPSLLTTVVRRDLYAPSAITKSPAPSTQLPKSPECGQRRMRIVGGLPAAEKKWPWQVSLQVQDKHICGASLIDHQWVLTAAHCIYGHLEYTAKLGDIHLHHQSATAAVVPIRDIVIHKDYTTIGEITNDIALALLDFPVNYSSYIQPVCLPEKTFQVQADTRCWVTGWGKLYENDKSKQAPLILQETDLNIIRYKECNKILKKYLSSSSDVVREGVVCGYNNQGKDSCQGDSGGPLVCEFNKTWMQVGIVSWGIGCGRSGIPGVYTEISYYKEWLFHQFNLSSSVDPEVFLILLLSLVLPLNILS